MTERAAYIVDAVRTPVAKRGGALAGVHSADLAAHTIAALVRRTGVDPGAVDDVILGCCDTIGSQAGDVARTAWLVAGLPDHVPGVTIDRQCGSSQQAVHFAAQGVMSGTQDLVVAGGVQNMSAIPISAAMLAGQQYGFSTPFTESPGWLERYGDQEVSQFRSAEMIAEKWDISREEMEAFALASHDRARTAIAEGRFKDEVVAYGDVDTDQCPRETSMEKMAGLEPLAPGGRITAAVASQICDASSAMLVASEAGVREHGLTPRARIHHLSVCGDDPVWMLTGPIRATKRALDRSGLSRTSTCSSATRPSPRSSSPGCARPGRRTTGST
jgi:acetyl-CoA C-acetyltransferase